MLFRSADPVGTGPFHYVSRSPQENIVLEKFSDYWDTENQAYLDKVTFRIVKDSNAVVTNLKSGTLDMYARLSSTQTAQLAEDSDFTIYDGGMNLVQALYLNNAMMTPDKDYGQLVSEHVFMYRPKYGYDCGRKRNDHRKQHVPGIWKILCAGTVRAI